ncbi:MAG: hypothetical protein CVU34_11035 [Betaproteobacteria bacterium HGW-Betaproteobacteria-7]|jgi:tetratricopeptide (TPR) repeat protein|nr:MAG: hypothetical protein CVU34_11035 [Betaproteobacteria bacterium HGW-Betaproteobacteria-7]
MHKKACHFALVLLIATLTAWADTTHITPPADDLSRKLLLAEQKSRLIDTLINTPTIKAANENDNPEAAAWINVSRTLLNQAREAMRLRQADEAIEKLDEALRSLSKASSTLANSRSASIVARKKQFEEQTNQLASYRRALEEMVVSPQTSLGARRLMVSLDQLSDQARKLFKNEQFEAANKRMDEAYKLAVSEISRLREGQEVVLTLNFSSPREEFDYEQKRYHSNQILVGMLTREGRAQGEMRNLVDGFVHSAGQMKEEATAKASANDYKTAIKDMETANQHLNRALQIMGVPVF